MLSKAIIKTVGEKCKVCYTCVRECPAKAIKVERGQASIITERCIHCGNCVKVCSQEAKEIVSSLSDLEIIFKEAKEKDKKIYCLLAPSFAAEYYDVPTPQVLGMLERLGFHGVYEVGFGADLIAAKYAELIKKDPSISYISTTCPSIVSYIEKYYQDLVEHLVPLPSPMIMMGNVIKEIRGEDSLLVFIGPCVAKKREVAKEKNPPIDIVLTFRELKDVLKQNKIFPSEKSVGEFCPPHSQMGNLFALSSGLLQTAGLDERLIEGNFINADGKANFIEAIREFKRGDFSPSLLDTLCCQGCIMGPGMTCKIPLYKRRSAVAKFVRDKMKNFNKISWEEDLLRFQNLPVERSFFPKEPLMDIPLSDNFQSVQDVLMKLKKHSKSDELNCGACGYDTCREHALAISRGLAETEMCLPYTIDRLKETVKDLEYSYTELKSVKETLSHREKLASMGQLSAGIAHELNNPLGVILMYAHLLLEDAKGLGNEGCEDIQMIVEQAQRCKRIVSGLLNFSRQNKVIRSTVEVSKLVRLVLDSLTLPNSENLDIEVIDELVEKTIEIDKDQIAQALINILNNSVDALEANENSSKRGRIQVLLKDDPNQLMISIIDNGPGIPQKIRGQIFDPFFTTKQIGKGTGLGLPVCYGILKMHSGTIDVFSTDEGEETGTTVKISIPKI